MTEKYNGLMCKIWQQKNIQEHSAKVLAVQQYGCDCGLIHWRIRGQNNRRTGYFYASDRCTSMTYVSTTRLHHKAWQGFWGICTTPG